MTRNPMQLKVIIFNQVIIHAGLRWKPEFNEERFPVVATAVLFAVLFDVKNIHLDELPLTIRTDTSVDVVWISSMFLGMIHFVQYSPTNLAMIAAPTERRKIDLSGSHS